TPPAAPAVPESVRRAASSTISVALDHQAHVGGDPRLEVEVRAAGDRDLDGVAELGPFLLRLDVPWRELGLARDVDDPAVVLAVAERVGADPRRLADPDAADPVLTDVDPAPAVAGVHERHDRDPGRDGLARLAVSDRDEPGEGRADLGVRERGGDLFDRGLGLPELLGPGAALELGQERAGRSELRLGVGGAGPDLRVVEAGEDRAGLDPVAFPDRDLRDPTGGLEAEV